MTLQAPVFSNVDITLGDVVGRLRCSATGDPAPTLFWIQPNGRTTKYSPSTASVSPAAPVGLGSASALPGAVEDGARRTDGVLILSGRASTADSSTLTGMYICVANNEAGNVTLAVNISWPLMLPATRQLPRPTAQSFPVDVDTDDLLRGLPLDELAEFPFNFTLLEDELSRRHERKQGTTRLFSVTELVCAVLVTHVATLLIVLALVAVFVHRRAVRRRRQQQLLPPVHPTAPIPTNDPDPRLLRGADPLPVGVGSTYRHNGFQLPGMTGRTTPYANDCLYESGTMRSGFSFMASNRR